MSRILFGTEHREVIMTRASNTFSKTVIGLIVKFALDWILPEFEEEDEWFQYERREDEKRREQLPEFEEDIDPVEDDVGQLCAECEVLQEEGDEG